MADERTIVLETADGVARLTLNRPDKLNSFTRAMHAELRGALARIDQISALICVLLLEIAVRLRRPLLQRPGDRLGLQLLDMVRLGLLYGLILDGFKLM